LILLALIQFYRWVLSPAKSTLFGPLGRCRFDPTCSNYALEAVRRHGALRGSWLAFRRICSCHPYGGCGHDPVPQKMTNVECRMSKETRNSNPAPKSQCDVRASDFVIDSSFVIRHSSFPSSPPSAPAVR
jgi:uncharacterized protein